MKCMQNVPYDLAVGSIMYAVRCTRHDVAFAQNITNRFQQNSGEAHWTAVKNILKFLRNTKDTFLVYGGDPEAELRVNCYYDAGFETDRDDTKSQIGSKQSTTAHHATEAEYIAASKAAKEAVWIMKFIDELGVVPSNDYPIKMNCDNSVAIIMAKESGIQKGIRHFKRKYHYVRVHDSFWTHACDIDQMNVILRVKFVELYNTPILENLFERFQTTYPGLEFPPLPQRGDFDLNEVLKSPCFFN
nr:hypothetical protein [Tanacetum cinerariifolium]